MEILLEKVGALFNTGAGTVAEAEAYSNLLVAFSNCVDECLNGGTPSK